MYLFILNSEVWRLSVWQRSMSLNFRIMHLPRWKKVSQTVYHLDKISC